MKSMFDPSVQLLAVFKTSVLTIFVERLDGETTVRFVNDLSEKNIGSLQINRGWRCFIESNFKVTDVSRSFGII